jgi:O-antigen ligase
MIGRELINKLTLYCVFIATFFLPLKTTFSNLGIIGVVLFSIMALVLQGYRKDVLKTPSFYFETTLALYIPIIIGTFYAVSLEEAFFHWKKSIFYFLVPTLVLCKELDRNKLIQWATRGLIMGSVLGMTYLLWINLYSFSASGLPIAKLLGYTFTGRSFMNPLPDLHPVYFGSYVVFMLGLLWYKKYQMNRILKWVITALTLIVVLFLNSRIVFLIALMFIGVLLFKSLNFRKAAAVLAGFVLLTLLVLPFLRETYLYNKMFSGTYWELTENVASPNTDADVGADSRMSRWKVSVELFTERPFTGHGTGSARDLLVERYRLNNMQASIRQGYDSHNQYLGYAIDYGIIGLVFLASFLFLNMKNAIGRADLPRLLFYLMIASICLTENYLIRNMGINFVALFGALFYLNDHD